MGRLKIPYYTKGEKPFAEENLTNLFPGRTISF